MHWTECIEIIHIWGSNTTYDIKKEKKKKPKACSYTTVSVSRDVQYASISSIYFRGQCYLLLSITSGTMTVYWLA